MTQHTITPTTLTRAEAIEALIEEFTTTDAFLDDLHEHRNDILGEYLESDQYMEAMAEAQAEIIAEFESSDVFEEELDETIDILTSDYRADLETLPDEALAEQVGVTIVPDGTSNEGD